MIREKIRRIAANYIYLPGHELVRYGYVEVGGLQEVTVVDTGGQIYEIAGLEFYGGLIVPGYVCTEVSKFQHEHSLLFTLDHLFAGNDKPFYQVAIIEGADLRELTWKTGARIRLL